MDCYFLLDGGKVGQQPGIVDGTVQKKGGDISQDYAKKVTGW